LARVKNHVTMCGAISFWCCWWRWASGYHCRHFKVRLTSTFPCIYTLLK